MLPTWSTGGRYWGGLPSPFRESRSLFPCAFVAQWGWFATSPAPTYVRLVLFSCPCRDWIQSRGAGNLAPLHAQMRMTESIIKMLLLARMRVAMTKRKIKEFYEKVEAVVNSQILKRANSNKQDQWNMPWDKNDCKKLGDVTLSGHRPACSLLTSMIWLTYVVRATGKSLLMNGRTVATSSLTSWRGYIVGLNFVLRILTNFSFLLMSFVTFTVGLREEMAWRSISIFWEQAILHTSLRSMEICILSLNRAGRMSIVDGNAHSTTIHKRAVGTAEAASWLR